MTSCPTRISAPVSIVERSTRTAIRECPSETALAEPVLGTAEEDSRTIRADFPRTPPKGADIAYRLKVGFNDAATLKEQRVTLTGGRTIDLKLPKGVEDGTKI